MSMWLRRSGVEGRSSRRPQWGLAICLSTVFALGPVILIQINSIRCAASTLRMLPEATNGKGRTNPPGVSGLFCVRRRHTAYRRIQLFGRDCGPYPGAINCDVEDEGA